MDDKKPPSDQPSAEQQIHSLFARARHMFKEPHRVLSENTGCGRFASEQWCSGRRTPSADVLTQVARNLRTRAVLLQDVAAEFDALSAALMRQHEIDHPHAAAHSRSLASETDESEPALPNGPEPDEGAWPTIRDLYELQVYITSLGDAPVPGVGRSWLDLNRREQEELALRMITRSLN